ncbi:hypothetical protein PIB30_016236 [Stylosanthes scabra]|uniref:Uncharacterized protein n=1 Tax=Stylosanthes scabra TaxID=79078 RepID=A0ABU6X5B9_9FABA|nr:hypothetical protein [Stylosanthes scabra]
MREGVSGFEVNERGKHREVSGLAGRRNKGESAGVGAPGDMEGCLRVMKEKEKQRGCVHLHSVRPIRGSKESSERDEWKNVAWHENACHHVKIQEK